MSRRKTRQPQEEEEKKEKEMKCVGYNQKRVGKSGSILKWMVIVLTSSLYFFYFFYVIRLAGTNEPGPTSNRREGVYTHKQYAINSNCLSNEEIIPLIKKCNHFFFNKSPRETTHLSKNKANHKINSKMVKCNVKQLIYSGESNKNNIHNMCIKIKTIRQFTTKLSLSYCITNLNPIVDTNQIKPKVLKYSYLQGLAINSIKQNKSKDEINNIILINKNDRLEVLRCFCTSPNQHTQGLKIDRNVGVYVSNRGPKGGSIIINTCRDIKYTREITYIPLVKRVFFRPNLAQKRKNCAVAQRKHTPPFVYFGSQCKEAVCVML